MRGRDDPRMGVLASIHHFRRNLRYPSLDLRKSHPWIRQGPYSVQVLLTGTWLVGPRPSIYVRKLVGSERWPHIYRHHLLGWWVRKGTIHNFLYRVYEPSSYSLNPLNTCYCSLPTTWQQVNIYKWWVKFILDPRSEFGGTIEILQGSNALVQHGGQGFCT